MNHQRIIQTLILTALIALFYSSCQKKGGTQNGILYEDGQLTYQPASGEKTTVPLDEQNVGLLVREGDVLQLSSARASSLLDGFQISDSSKNVTFLRSLLEPGGFLLEVPSDHRIVWEDDKLLTISSDGSTTQSYDTKDTRGVVAMENNIKPGQILLAYGAIICDNFIDIDKAFRDSCSTSRCECGFKAGASGQGGSIQAQGGGGTTIVIVFDPAILDPDVDLSLKKMDTGLDHWHHEKYLTTPDMMFARISVQRLGPVANIPVGRQDTTATQLLTDAANELLMEFIKGKYEIAVCRNMFYVYEHHANADGSMKSSIKLTADLNKSDIRIVSIDNVFSIIGDPALVTRF